MTLPVLTSNLLSDQPVIYEGHSSLVYSVAFSPSHPLLASGSSDKTIRLWNTVAGAEVATLKEHSHPLTSVAFSPDGTMLASGSRNGDIKLWDVESRAQIATFGIPSNMVYSVAFSPDGTRLVSGSNDKTVRLWDVNSRTSISALKGHSSEVLSVSFSPDGRRIASGSYDFTVRLWDAAVGTNIATLRPRALEVTSIAFSPSGDQLASGSRKNGVQLWDVATGVQIAALQGHSGAVMSVAFSPNGKQLASGSYDKTIRFWDAASRTHISTLEGHAGAAQSISFSPDSTRLASGSADETVRIWSVPSEEARGAQSVTSTSDWIGLSQSTANNPVDTATSPPISISLKNDISGMVSLQDSTPIGSGGFGDLFLGIHKDHGKVALKKPRRLLDEDLIRRFLREVDMWCSVSHPHVLPCLGMCKIGLDIYVVSPFIENGDLLSCMTGGKDLDRSKLLFEVAEALTHLHHRGVVHGDVKAQNILLADDGTALLCDFGLAKAFDTMVTSTESKGAGSVRWMAPELSLGESRSMASDVYSFGITIAEVLSGQAPFLDIADNLAVMFHVVYHDGRPSKEPLSSPEGKSYATLWETAEKCWAKEPKVRPHMAQVLGMLFPITRDMT